MTRFNEAIDEALTTSISRYSDTVNNTRDQFLGILSHDLRNPLSAILSGARLLKRLPNASVERIATIIITSSERMNRMVTELLDLARTRLGSGIPVTSKPMNLASLCNQIIQELRESYPDRHLEVEFIGDLHGEWDSDRLAQVILNLATNAFKYGTTAKPVSITARDDGANVLLEVHNEGQPIPDGSKKSIFEPMTRLQSEDRREDKNTDGLGLGLFITSEIVKSHCGAISLTSTAKEGTTFIVKLPRYPPSHGAPTVH